MLRVVAQGETNAEIEQALHLSSATVEEHVNSIFGSGSPTARAHRRAAAVSTSLQDGRNG